MLRTVSLDGLRWKDPVVTEGIKREKTELGVHRGLCETTTWDRDCTVWARMCPADGDHSIYAV
jgi:hypothetical protein